MSNELEELRQHYGQTLKLAAEDFAEVGGFFLAGDEISVQDRERLQYCANELEGILETLLSADLIDEEEDGEPL